MQFINAFSFDVDFQRDIRQGDSFEVLYETYVDENGVSVKDGKLLYGCLTVQGSAMKVYLFTSQEGEEDYYHEDGRSVRKTLIRTPINGAHLSFTYGKQQHPIYGYSYTHKGLDFAAPVGTPIMAAERER
jgi:murein DD-endopeptidase MepM/ murein hydrolase activator NlpD